MFFSCVGHCINPLLIGEAFLSLGPALLHSRLDKNVPFWGSDEGRGW
jgi:hypothetical protein